MNTPKNLPLKLTNTLHHIHGLFCDCNEGIYHCLKEILQQTGKEFNKKQQEQLKKCLGSTQETTGTDAADIDFGEDLDALFADDGEEKETG